MCVYVCMRIIYIYIYTYTHTRVRVSSLFLCVVHELLIAFSVGVLHLFDSLFISRSFFLYFFLSFFLRAGRRGMVLS